MQGSQISDSRPEHPSQLVPAAPSFADYGRRTPEASPEPTEDQLAFRRYVQGGGVIQAEAVEPELAPEASFVTPVEDVPEF